MLTVNWPMFFGLIAVCYLAINIVFALLYLAGGNCIENARPGSFFDVFFFSVQTMASIGYGAMYPVTSYANIIVTIEALVGLMALAMATGLMFARFSRPTARVIFSRRAVITPHNGVPTLMFRTANERDNRILEAQLRVSLLRYEVTLEGESMRRFYDMKLLRSQTPSFGLTWTVMHPIDQSSPLYGETPESLAEMEATLIITLVGIDETVSQTIHARHSYTASEILWDRRFVDMFHRKSDGSRIIDYSHFHDIK
ncbi:inward rectifier potassium channel [Moorena producens 3L]|uniref:Inward rectifier potassium channel n=2 Tax=Coleofasciculaceae TaxID=1892251 RepID=F4XVN5_9CYAN|nr:inward rectifier potassium channel [Moorena producens 3L]